MKEIRVLTSMETYLLHTFFWGNILFSVYRQIESEKHQQKPRMHRPNIPVVIKAAFSIWIQREEEMEEGIPRPHPTN